MPRRLPCKPRPNGAAFPGWRWVAVALAFPIAGYIGWTVGGRVDAVGAALLGGALTGAGLGAVQWWAANGALGRAAAWIGASAVGYAVGLAAGAALVGYDTDLGDLAAHGRWSAARRSAPPRGSSSPAQGPPRARAAVGARDAGALRARLVRGIGHRHRRRRPVHRVRRRRRAAVHAAQRPAARALHPRPRAGGVMDAVDHVVLGAGAVGMAVVEALVAGRAVGHGRDRLAQPGADGGQGFPRCSRRAARRLRRSCRRPSRRERVTSREC